MLRSPNPLILVPLLLGGCGKVEPDPFPCGEAAPTCVAPSVSCGAPTTVSPVCDATSEPWSWRCPPGSSVYVPPAAPPPACLPFHAANSPIAMLGGSLVRVPIDDGRCLWIGEDVTTTSGAALRNVGFLAGSNVPLGTCPTTPELLGALGSAVTISGSHTDVTVQIDGGFLFEGETRVMYRLFEPDPSAAFGTTEIGGGLGTWDAATQQIVVGGPDDLEFYPDINLGHASLSLGSDVYMWGCHPPIDFLSEPCALARLDATGVDYLGTNDTWIADAAASQTATLFSDGPWIASVVLGWTGGFQHVYAVGFGTTLETDTANEPTGPWTAGPTLASCRLPSDDSHAFCAGPVVHEELADPTVGGQRVVSYGVGTTAAMGQASNDPDGYWTRLVWINP